MLHAEVLWDIDTSMQYMMYTLQIDNNSTHANNFRLLPVATKARAKKVAHLPVATNARVKTAFFPLPQKLGRRRLRIFPLRQTLG